MHKNHIQTGLLPELSLLGFPSLSFPPWRSGVSEQEGQRAYMTPQVHESMHLLLLPLQNVGMRGKNMRKQNSHPL